MILRLHKDTREGGVIYVNRDRIDVMEYDGKRTTIHIGGRVFYVRETPAHILIVVSRGVKVTGEAENETSKG